ncbi:MAG: hypothetical protein PUH40_01560 [Lachnospiraceae bacterium]|nr:hypothetical protein [Lachnospiraceae bacterium]
MTRLDMAKSASLEELALSYGMERGIETWSDVERVIDLLRFDLQDSYYEDYLMHRAQQKEDE